MDVFSACGPHAGCIRDDVILVGDTQWHPVLGSHASSNGYEEWTFRCEGTYLICMGVVGLDISLDKAFFEDTAPPKSWAVAMSNTKMWLDGTWKTRHVGPENFCSQLPLEAVLKVDRQ